VHGRPEKIRALLHRHQRNYFLHVFKITRYGHIPYTLKAKRGGTTITGQRFWAIICSE
jgi:hypothetical protein